MRVVRILGIGLLLFVGVPKASATVTDPASTVAGLQGQQGSRTIVYAGAAYDEADLQWLGARARPGRGFRSSRRRNPAEKRPPAKTRSITCRRG